MSPTLRQARLITYQGHPYLLWRVDGRPVRKSVARFLDLRPSAVTEALARQALDQLNEQIYQRHAVLPRAAHQTLGDCFTALREEFAADGTRDARQVDQLLTRLTTQLGHWRVARFSADDARQLVETWTQYYRPNYIYDLAGWVKRALKLAIERGWLGRMPKWPRLPRRTPRNVLIPPEWWEAIRGAYQATEGPWQDAAEFAFLSGFRIGETLALTWAMVDLVGQRLCLPTSKNGDPRPLPIDDPELTALITRRARLRDPACPHVFHADGQRLAYRTTIRRLQEAAARAGFPQPVVFHDLRRAAVTNLIDGGIPPHVAMKVTGHRTLSTLSWYHVESIEPMREALHRVRGYVSRRVREAKTRQTELPASSNPPSLQAFPRSRQHFLYASKPFSELPTPNVPQRKQIRSGPWLRQGDRVWRVSRGKNEAKRGRTSRRADTGGSA
jgi:integrase